MYSILGNGKLIVNILFRRYYGYSLIVLTALENPNMVLIPKINIKKIICLVHLIGLSFLFTHLLANNSPIVYFTNLTKKDGLSSNYINKIIKDKQGFIWIATSDGLCRYETHDRIKIFRANSGNTNTIQSSNIWTIYPDSKDNLWIGTRHGGLTRYHQPTDTWTTFKNRANDPSSISNNEILSILEDHEGRIWVGTENGLNLFQSETETFISFKVQRENAEALQGKAVLSIHEDALHRLWIGTWGGGLHLMLPDTNKDIHNSTFRNFKPFDDEGSHNVWSILEYHPDQLLIGSHGGGLITMQLPKGASTNKDAQNWVPEFQRHQYFSDKPSSLLHDDIKGLELDKDGVLWIATGRGINSIAIDRLFSTSKEITPSIEFSKITRENQDINGLITNTLTTIYHDDQGMLWVGSVGGISIFNPLVNQFKQFELPEILIDDRYQNIITIDNKGDVLGLSIDDGLTKFNFKQEQKINFFQKDKALNKQMNALFASTDNQVFLGSDKGLVVLDQVNQTTKFYPFPSSFPSLNNLYIRYIYRDKVIHKIWAATDNGLIMLDEKTGIYQMYTNNPNDPTSISENSINHIYEDKLGNLWIATYTGLNRLSLTDWKEKPIFELFHSEASNPANRIPLNRIITVQGTDSILYIGASNGLMAYNLLEKKITNFSENTNKFWVRSLIVTKEGNLWGATTAGLFFFNTVTKVFNVFEKEDGLVDTDFKINGGFRDAEENIYFVHTKGITEISSGNIITNQIPPKLIITDIKILDSEGEQLKEGSALKELEINNNTYSLSLKFAALNYNRPEKNQYAFRLKGFEERWNYSNKTEAVYTNLDPGEYVFQLKAANNDGVWNNDLLEFKITKHPAFWQTIWFKLGSILSICFLIFAGTKWYNKTLSDRNILLEDYNQTLNLEIEERQKIQGILENKEFQLQAYNQKLVRSNKELEQFAYIASHDLRSPLNTVISFINILQKSVAEKLSTKEHEMMGFISSGAKNMEQLVNAILEFSKINNGGLELKKFSPTKLLEIIQLELSATLKEKNAKIFIGAMPESILADRVKIKQLLQNLITNGIKFSKNGEMPIVQVSCIADKDYWQFKVVDNGIGIDKEYNEKIFKLFQRLHSAAQYEGTGIGLSLCKKIVELHEGEIWLESEVGKGSTFFFTIKKEPKQLMVEAINN